MSRPRSRPLSIRIDPGSALDRLTTGPQTDQLGLTRRVHDIAERYEELLKGSEFLTDLKAGRRLDAARHREGREANELAALPPRDPRSRKPIQRP